MRFNLVLLIQLIFFALECLSSPAPRHRHSTSHVVHNASSSSSTTGSSSTHKTSSSFILRSSTTIFNISFLTSSIKPSSTSSATKSSLSLATSSSSAVITSSISSAPKSSVTSTLRGITTSSITPSPSPTAGGNPSAKRGIPYNSPATYIQHFNSPGSKVTWAYNWDSLMDTNFPTYLEYVPMLWGNGTSHTTNWMKNAQNAIARGSKALLAFNEPDACGGGGSCITPEAAAAAYRTYLQPFAGQVKLGGPAVTEVGIAWLLEFLSLCSNCTIDFIPMHIYNSATNVAYYKAHMTDIANQTGRPIWLTEFSASGNQTAFLETLMTWMDAQLFIERYSWFMCSPGYSGSTCGADGYPTTLGELYELF